MKIEDLAGKTVGVEIGGFEEAKTHAVAEALKQKGLAGLTIRTFDTFAVATRLSRQGRSMR